MQYAITHKKTGNIERLVQHGVDLVAELLHLAGADETGDELGQLAETIPPDTRNSQGRTAASTAVEKGMHKALRVLLGKGASFVLKDSSGRSPLMWAAHLASDEAVKTCISSWPAVSPSEVLELVNVFITSDISSTFPLTIMILGYLTGSYDLVRAFPEPDPRGELSPFSFFGPLHLAVMANNLPLIGLLLCDGRFDVNNGAETDPLSIRIAPDWALAQHLDTLICLATLGGFLPIVEYLFGLKGAVLNLNLGAENTTCIPLSLAALRGHFSGVEYLVACGAIISHELTFNESLIGKDTMSLLKEEAENRRRGHPPWSLSPPTPPKKKNISARRSATSFVDERRIY